jgi:hypothetical protein
MNIANSMAPVITITRIRIRNLRCDCGRPYVDSDFVCDGTTIQATCNRCHDRVLELELGVADQELD